MHRTVRRADVWPWPGARSAGTLSQYYKDVGWITSRARTGSTNLCIDKQNSRVMFLLFSSSLPPSVNIIIIIIIIIIKGRCLVIRSFNKCYL